jgi:hypothetical protein
MAHTLQQAANQLSFISNKLKQDLYMREEIDRLIKNPDKPEREENEGSD